MLLNKALGEIEKVERWGIIGMLYFSPFFHFSFAIITY